MCWASDLSCTHGHDQCQDLDPVIHLQVFFCSQKSIHSLCNVMSAFSHSIIEMDDILTTVCLHSKCISHPIKMSMH